MVRDDTIRASAGDDARHDRLYKRACDLVHGHLLVDVGPRRQRLSWLTRRRLRKAVKLFEQVIAIKPERWPAYWMLGKVHQRLGEFRIALNHFAHAHRLNPGQPDVAREASIAALELGDAGTAVELSEAALGSRPGDAGLLCNLALARLMIGDPEQARLAAKEAVRCDRADPVAPGLLRLIERICGGDVPCPRRLVEVERALAHGAE
jgi:tetratricopeptide (TPR) repeat protein